MSQTWHKLSSETLISGSTFEDGQMSLRAKIFGKMIKLSEDVIENYQSDLYHDALWLNEHITGAMSFDWIVRSGGTFIGDVCLHVQDKDWPGTLRFRLELMVEGDKKWVLNTYQALEHESLPIEQCDVATTAAGCIYHPAPVKEFQAVTTVANLPTGDWREEVPGTGKDYYGNPVKFQPEIKETTQEQVEDIMKLLFEPNFPTLRNDLNMEPSAPTRKEMKMDDIIRDLREKFNEAEASKDQLEEYQGNINDAIDELDTYMSDLDDLINSLDSLPEVSVYVDLDTVSFDS